MRRPTIAALIVCNAMSPAAFVPRQAEQDRASLFFTEHFDDDRLPERGWYDGSKFQISSVRPFSGAGSLEYHWPSRATVPDSSSGIRHLFTPHESVYLGVSIRLSQGWGWTGRDYHPHLMHFMTTENGKFHGPAASHLTVYIEPHQGKLRLAAQDMQNKDQPSGLTQGPLRGGYNGKFYDSEAELFRDDQWHRIEALFKLNSIDENTGKAKPDGVARAWFDGRLVIDRKDLLFRSADFPSMKFNQFLLLPYFGPGLLPHEQTMWIDELSIGSKRPGT